MSPEIFLLLVLALFMAAATGWWTARRTKPSIGPEQITVRPFKDQYFEGLNFLLNEEPDKALEVFLRMVEVDDETVETHFALGTLYRRRGEVDRSIRVHENIMARPNLQPNHREHGMFALAEDYFRAGLYDRAEQLFQRLAESSGRRVGALRHLLRIYEQQSEWHQAIAVYERLAYLVSPEYPTAIAHYYCELAEHAHSRGEYAAARELLRKVREHQRHFPRGALIRADIALAMNEPERVLQLCRRVVELHPQLLPLALPRVTRALKLAPSAQLKDAFASWVHSDAAGRADIAYAAIVAGLENEPLVLECLRDFLRSDPNLGDLVPALVGDPAMLDEERLRSLATALGRIFRRTQRYRCVECGLASASHFWQCPGCRSWDGLAPLARLDLSLRSRPL